MLPEKIPRTLILVLILFLSACGDRVERICPTPNADGAANFMSVEVEPAVSPTPLTTQAANELWASSPHALTEAPDQPEFKRDCQVCHAPLMISVGSVASSSQPVDQGDPPGDAIGCAVCHPQESGQESDRVALLIDPISGEYRAVDSGSALCEACHVGDQREGHLPINLQGAHDDLRCLACHDAHSNQASCGESGCHQPFRAECEPIPAHDKPHSTVTCTACHAHGEVKIKWDEDLQAWHSFFPVMKAGELENKSRHGHNLGREVICERCHTPGQLPWMEEY